MKKSNVTNKDTKVYFMSSELIFDKNQLKYYLKKEKNSYSCFILKKIDKKSNILTDSKVHIHHIIPRHWGGPDNDWNLIKLSIEEHAYAHLLLYENYANIYDLGAFKMIQGQIKEGFDFIQKSNHCKMKKMQVGLYNSEIKSELRTRRKKQRKSYARNHYIKTALENGLILK